MMSMAEPAKYMFDREFELQQAADGSPILAQKVFSRADIEALRGDAFAEGFAAGRAEVVAEDEHAVAGALSAIAQAVPRILDGLNAERARLEDEARRLSLAVARKMAPALVEQMPVAEIEAILDEAMAHLSHEPFIAVRVHESVVEALAPRTDAIAAEHGFEGRLVLISEPDLAPADCRIEWADGGISRDTERLDKAIDDIVRRHIGDRPPDRSAAPRADGPQTQITPARHAAPPHLAGEPAAAGEDGEGS